MITPTPDQGADTARPLWLFGATIVELHFKPKTDMLIAVMVEKDGQRALLTVKDVWNDLGQILPGGTVLPTNPRDLLTDEQNAKLNEDLAEMSRQRRRAEAASRDIPLC